MRSLRGKKKTERGATWGGGVCCLALVKTDWVCWGACLLGVVACEEEGTTLTATTVCPFLPSKFVRMGRKPTRIT